jgi:hypothetical protein
MNQEKLPNLDWCEKHGHLFKDTDLVFENSENYPKSSYRHSVLSKFILANCPDAIDIMEWLWENGWHEVRPNPLGGANLCTNQYRIPGRIGNSWIEALMEAVRIVEEGK